jgi:hypothetical protein
MEQRKQRKVAEKFRDLDLYSQHVKLTFDGGKTQFKTKVGALFTVLMVISSSVYALFKFVSLIQRQDVTVKVDLVDGFFDDKTEHTFYGNEIAIAFGMTKKSGKVDEDISMYGELSAYYKTWDMNLSESINEIPVR